MGRSADRIATTRPRILDASRSPCGGLEAVETATRGVERGVADVLGAIQLQAEIAARQEVASAQAARRLERLTRVLVALTAAIAILTVVLVARGG